MSPASYAESSRKVQARVPSTTKRKPLVAYFSGLFLAYGREVIMSKFGLKKGTVHDRAADEQVAHVHVPGRAYNVADPVTKLIHIIGGGFFNEPKYYDTNRSYVEFMVELLTTGKISSTIKDETGLTEQAR